MLKIIQILVVGVLTSLFFFPFEFSFLPGANTKMMLAGMGLLLFGINQLKREKTDNSGQKDFAVLSLWAALVSLVAFAAITYNNTYDYTYVSYIVSMWVWLGGAYAAVQLMRMVHGEVTVELVMNYLIGVCVGQCAIALTMELVPAVKGFVDSFLGSTGFMGRVKERMYGIGASLDVAGSRFSSALLMIAYLTLQVDKQGKKMLLIPYLVAFFLYRVHRLYDFTYYRCGHRAFDALLGMDVDTFGGGSAWKAVPIFGRGTLCIGAGCRGPVSGESDFPKEY